MRRRPALMQLLAALAGFAVLVGAFAPPVEAAGKLPECRIEDVLTVPRGYDDWSHTLVDWLLRVEDDYVPPDLVPVSEAGIGGGGLIRAVAIDDLREMAAAAAANGTPIAVGSPYRDYQKQVEDHNRYLSIDGDEANTYSMPPGHSEHQLGLAIDFVSAGGNPGGDWAYAPAGAWMLQNAWKYGWVLSYPIAPSQVGTDNLWSDKLCFSYEPWHYRYLGRKVARKVHESGLTIREYLWKHYTQLTTNLEPVATPTPTPSPVPTPSATPTPSEVPSGAAAGSASPSPTPTHGAAVAEAWFGVAPPVVLAIGAAALLLLVLLATLVTRRGSRRG